MEEGTQGAPIPSHLELALTATLGTRRGGRHAAQGRGSGDGLPLLLPLLALRPQPRRGLGPAGAGIAISQPYAFGLLTRPPRAGWRSPCSQNRDKYEPAPLTRPAYSQLGEGDREEVVGMSP